MVCESLLESDVRRPESGTPIREPDVPALDVLVVEDDNDDFFLVDELLRSQMAARTWQAGSVEEARRQIAQSAFDIILLDYSLGALTGLDLLEELRSRDVTTPAIVLTGHGGEEIAVRALKAGAADYLPKARLNASSLGSAIRHALALRERDAAVREAREALSAREREYRMLFEEANDAIVILDPESEEILAANAAASRLYDCPVEGLVGASLIEFSTDIIRGRAAIESCLASGRLSNHETEHVTRQGRRAHILVNASAIEYRGRRALLCTSRDISERKAAEQEIFRLNRALKALSRCSAALLHAHDQQQLLDEICKIVVEDAGYRMAWVAQAPTPPDNCIRALASHGATAAYLETLCMRYNASANCSLLVPTAFRTGAPAVCRDTATDPRSASLRQECVERGYASILVLPLLVERKATAALAIYASECDAFDDAEVGLLTELAGNVSFGVASIDSRRQKEIAEKKLRESEQRYRALFERNLAAVFRARADGTLLEANEAFVRMLGYDTSAELVDLRLEVLCAAAGFVEPWCAELKTAGQLINRELRLVRKDGATAYLLANLVLLRDAAGNPESIEGTALDITQRRQLEAQLLQSQKMEAIGRLAGGIAHDFNNLLMVIRSYAELVAESLDGGSLADASVSGVSGEPASGTAGRPGRHELEAILKAADRGAALTRQLLTFGRKQIFSPRLLDINSVLENITKVLPRALGEDVRVEMRAASGLWQVKADPVQIEQLVLNLAVNARDAMPGGGRLVLETSNTELDGEYVKLHADVVPGDYVMLAVTDTGQGIAREDLPRIFEPFFTTKERGKGTGLGLSTVYGIVQQSGGFIWVYSEPGEGTVFKIYLPRAEAAAASGLRTPDSGCRTPDTGTETILLVEDEEAVRSAARQYLSLRGYTVLEASCGEEALRVCAGHLGPIHLLITDAVMPGMSGSALAREMSARRPAMRIICVSGYTEATMGEHGVAPAAAFLQKPFSLAALARKVRELLDAPGFRSEASQGSEQRVA